MANKDQKNRSANNKPKLSVKEKKEAQGEKSRCQAARPLRTATPRTPPFGRGGSGIGRYRLRAGRRFPPGGLAQTPQGGVMLPCAVEGARRESVPRPNWASRHAPPFFCPMPMIYLVTVRSDVSP